MTTLETYVLNSVGQKTATLADVKENTKLATKPDHENMLLSFFDTGVLKILVLAGIIGHETEELDRNGKAELVPTEQWQALVFWVMGEWLFTIGEPALAESYLRRSGLPLTEADQYRFKPGFPAKVVRPYNMMG